MQHRCPPLQKAQERGTHRFEWEAHTKPKGLATRPHLGFDRKTVASVKDIRNDAVSTNTY
jgi:hypothetical protein